MADLKALLSDFQSDFVDKAKTRFKDRWANLPDEVKKAIEFTAREGSKVALEIAAGGNPDTDPGLKSKVAVLRANALDIEFMAKVEMRAFVEDALAEAAKIGGTLFKKFLKAVIAG